MTRMASSRTNNTGNLPTQSLLQWSYSQHYLAEFRGEEVIEHLLTFCHKPIQRKILHAQILDEQKHVRLFRSVVDCTGMDNTADEFANGYVRMVKSCTSLSEKIFCFQILTEAVSAAFCKWRMNLVLDPTLRAIDSEVLSDETRHLGMGQCLLTICNPEELSTVLDHSRRGQFLRDMNAICGTSFIKTEADGFKIADEELSVRKALF